MTAWYCNFHARPFASHFANSSLPDPEQTRQEAWYNDRNMARVEQSVRQLYPVIEHVQPKTYLSSCGHHDALYKCHDLLLLTYLLTYAVEILDHCDSIYDKNHWQARIKVGVGHGYCTTVGPSVFRPLRMHC